MTLMLRILPRWLFRRIKPARQAPTLRRGLAPVCAITVASAVASCGDDSTTPSPTTDMTIVTTDTTTVPTTTDSTVDTTGTPTTGTTSSVDTTGAGMTTGATSGVDTTGTGTTTDTTVDTGTPTTASTSDTAGTSTTADTTMVDTTTDTMSDTTTADTTSDTTTTDPTDPPILTFGEIDYRILIPSCANVICHTGPPYFEPVLGKASGGTLHNTLLTWKVEECDNQPLVVPGDPENSALLMLVRRECEPIVVESTGEVFESMPPFCTEPLCLHQDDYDALVAWINAGAPE